MYYLHSDFILSFGLLCPKTHLIHFLLLNRFRVILLSHCKRSTYPETLSYPTLIAVFSTSSALRKKTQQAFITTFPTLWFTRYMKMLFCFGFFLTVIHPILRHQYLCTVSCWRYTFVQIGISLSSWWGWLGLCATWESTHPDSGTCFSILITPVANTNRWSTSGISVSRSLPRALNLKSMF